MYMSEEIALKALVAVEALEAKLDQEIKDWNV
jgi:hypothetical protein